MPPGVIIRGSYRFLEAKRIRQRLIRYIKGHNKRASHEQDMLLRHRFVPLELTHVGLRPMNIWRERLG